MISSLFSLVVFALISMLPPDRPQRAPVVVELFTSEGCSSCPPADALLRELETKQPVSAAEIIPLGFHVDYWNGLGWKDRFSSREFTRRQRGYGSLFTLDSVYTPQMVVDGRLQFVGNDPQRALEAIRKAARGTKVRVELRRASSGNLDVRVIDVGEKSAKVLLAITESDLSSSVSAGENNGRQLRHTAVVRSLETLGETRDGQFHTTATLVPDPGWRAENLRAVVFVQRQGSEILGAATLPLR